MHPPLCPEELENQLYTAPPRGLPIPQTAQARPAGLGCVRRCARRNWKCYRTRHPSWGVLSPKRATRDWRDSGVSAAAWEGARSQIVHGTPMGHPYPPNGPGRTRDTKVYPPLCGEQLEVQSYQTPNGASLSRKRPRQDRMDSVFSAAVWGGASSSIRPERLRHGVPIPQTAQAGPEGLGCIRRCVGGS